MQLIQYPYSHVRFISFIMCMCVNSNPVVKWFLVRFCSWSLLCSARVCILSGSSYIWAPVSVETHFSSIFDCTDYCKMECGCLYERGKTFTHSKIHSCVRADRFYCVFAYILGVRWSSKPALIGEETTDYYSVFMVSPYVLACKLCIWWENILHFMNKSLSEFKYILSMCAAHPIR